MNYEPPPWLGPLTVTVHNETDHSLHVTVTVVGTDVVHVWIRPIAQHTLAEKASSNAPAETRHERPPTPSEQPTPAPAIPPAAPDCAELPSEPLEHRETSTATVPGAAAERSPERGWWRCAACAASPNMSDEIECGRCGAPRP